MPITSRSKLVEIPEEVSPPVPAPSAVEFDSFYREHLDFVWRSLRRFGVADASLDDATQEVFLVVYRRFHEFRPESSARAWLFAIAHRTASTHRRWVKRKGNLLPLHDELHATSSSPLEGAMTREASDLVLAFLGELDEVRRVAFMLSDLEQMTAPEIATAVGANVNTIYYRIASARKAFVAFLERRRVHEGEGS